MSVNVNQHFLAASINLIPRISRYTQMFSTRFHAFSRKRPPSMNAHPNDTSIPPIIVSAPL